MARESEKVRAFTTEDEANVACENMNKELKPTKSGAEPQGFKVYSLTVKGDTRYCIGRGPSDAAYPGLIALGGTCDLASNPSVPTPEKYVELMSGSEDQLKKLQKLIKDKLAAAK